MAEAILLILIHSHMNRYHNSFALSEKRQVLQIIESIALHISQPIIALHIPVFNLTNHTHAPILVSGSDWSTS